ncbi:hypothetical protein OIV83_005160 [Microbotryomycetes sp. JL201]|nr:hypothetical protein OIV83_005160 [Microbotryomycetes sp. JL201]
MAAPPGARRDPHIVALKVLRAAKPSLVRAEPLYYEDTSMGSRALQKLDANSIGQQGDTFDVGLTSAFMLPSTFGTIYLGETFSALLSLSNDLARPPDGTTTASSLVMKVEMNTGAPEPPAIPAQPGATPAPQQLGGLKHHLATVHAPEDGLRPGQSVDTLVSHEIKELGLHALVCTVTYASQVPDEAGHLRTVSRSFRKVYKFQVSNPLSVRTKAHAPNVNVANAVMAASERNKIFLEVQVQNQCETAMTFERMRFDPVTGMQVLDLNTTIFQNESTFLSPGAVRQFLFVLTSDDSGPPPGSSQELGRLELVWRTPHGELGRLQTSMLGRRVPPAPPQLVTPPQPQSNLRVSNDAVTSSSAHDSLPAPRAASDTHLDPSFDLTVETVSPQTMLRTGQPFSIAYKLRVRSASAEPRPYNFAVQHVNWYSTTNVSLDGPQLPPPVPTRASLAVEGPRPSRGVEISGASTQFVTVPAGLDECSFSMQYIAPDMAGPHRVGGTRVLLLEHSTSDASVSARTVFDVNVVAEIWVTTRSDR